MRFETHLSLRIVACLSAACLLVGCRSSDARARAALSAYQTATASDDLAGERRALLQLVQAKDDVPDYWVELGKLEAFTGSYSDAYYAFSRAYELDRSNVEVLRAVTQLALRAGDLPSAMSHAQELEVLSPGDPWPKLTKGWSSISELHFDEALTAADAILANSPYDPSATALKARALIGLKREDDARNLLVKQTEAQPGDVGSLELLAQIYDREDNWPNLLAVAQRLNQRSPANPKNALNVIEAGLRSGNIEVARAASRRLLSTGAPPALVNSVLELWEEYWPSQQRIDDARSLAAQATSLQSRLAYASFLSRVGSPADAVRLSSSAATLPVNAANAEANAVLGDALATIGNTGPAKSRLDAVIAFDPGNATALRARAELELRIGQPKAAVVDAEKLATVLPNSAKDRLLLARTYQAEGNSAWVNRTLWSAFQDIPANERLFAALQATRKGDADATRELQEEFDHQRDAILARGLI
ncbi:MAG TPA: tetratricopeptide repeat protein [Sphingomicrobium sp.]|nr:tetratricopeptide repeat protein [Sphingomicrobium sp.]